MFALSQYHDSCFLGKKILVTGGAGFLGSSLCAALAGQGGEVTVLDSFMPGSGANMANLSSLDIALVRAAMEEADLHALCEGADFIFNLAGQTGHLAAQLDPFADLAVNAMAQLRLIAAVRDVAPEAVIVHASTRQCYGRTGGAPVDESHVSAPQDFNGVSKLAGEQYWMAESRVHGRKVTALRLTNCYGPRLRLQDGRQTFLGTWLRHVLLSQPFEVWGGQQVRDFTYVDDVTAAFMAAATTPDCFGHLFNIGGYESASLLTLAELLVEVAPLPARYIVKELPEERARIDIGAYCADDRAFRGATGWKPRISLAEGLRQSLEWYRPRVQDYV
ncbi:NAD dependent epimerase/dehydratase family [Granulibacter bethesdensis]|nr:NAD-dependent epimerase/dehydratase family protein [Granulibacter bethesdensis]APH59492.1 NAD dependent epimerase/dehydratase family [Granulibacter bethesdensis]